MARKKTKKKTTTRRAAPVVVEEDETIEESLDPVDLAFEEFGEDEPIKLLIKRYDEMEASWGYLKQVPYQPDTHTLEWIRHRWGPGKYLLIFKGGDHSRSKVFAIAPDERDDKPATTTPAHDTRDRYLDALEKQNQTFLSAILAFVTAKPEAPASSVDPVVLKLLEGLNAEKRTILEATLAQRAADAVKPDALEKSLAFLEKGMEIAGELKGGDGDGMAAIFKSALKELGPAFAELMRQRANQPPTLTVRPDMNAPAAALPPPTSVATPPGGVSAIDTPFSRAMPSVVPTNEPPPPAAASPPAVNVSEMSTPMGAATPPAQPTAAAPTSEEILRHLLPAATPELLNRAARGGAIEDAGDWILDNTPAAAHYAFERLDADTVIAMEPRFGSHRAFVEELTRYLRVQVSEDEP